LPASGSILVAVLVKYFGKVNLALVHLIGMAAAGNVAGQPAIWLESANSGVRCERFRRRSCPPCGVLDRSAALIGIRLSGIIVVDLLARA